MRLLVSAELARGVCAKIPLFFVGQFSLQSALTVIATLLFFPEIGTDGFFDHTSKAMEALTDRVRANYDFSEQLAFGLSLNPPQLRIAHLFHTRA